MDYDNYSPVSLAGYIESTKSALDEVSDCFDSIVVRGVSGLAVGAPVAYLMNKPVVIIRKPGVSSHSHSLVSNFLHIGQRYVIVDDFVSLGRTMAAIQDAVSKESASLPRPKFHGPLPVHAQALVQLQVSRLVVVYR